MIREIEKQDISELESEALDSDGALQVMTSAFYARFDQDQLIWFCVQYGLYLLPTVELVLALRQLIRGRKAIEVGAGNGCLGRALGIRMFDNFHQLWDPNTKEFMRSVRQPVVKYGADVERCDGAKAVRLRKPEVVIGAWNTNKYEERYHERDGNVIGIDARAIVRRAHYIMVGSTDVHKNNHLVLEAKPEVLKWKPTIIYSRCYDASSNVVFLWKRQR